MIEQTDLCDRNVMSDSTRIKHIIHCFILI